MGLLDELFHDEDFRTLIAEGRETVALLRQNVEGQKQSNLLLERIHHELRKLDRHLHPQQLSHFVISQGDIMSELKPGQVVNLTASPVDAAGNPTTLPVGVALAWTSSDPANVPVTSSGTPGDLTAVATVGPNPPAETVTFSVDLTAPLADGTNPTGSATDTVDAPPPPPPAEVASFVITEA